MTIQASRINQVRLKRAAERPAERPAVEQAPANVYISSANIHTLLEGST
jgi:hypothetical protein